MSKKNKKKFKKKFRAQMMQEMQKIAKEEGEKEKESDKPSEKPSTQNKPLITLEESKNITKSPRQETPEEFVAKGDLLKVAWVLGTTVVILVILVVINYQTTWLVSFSDFLAKFAHIIK